MLKIPHVRRLAVAGIALTTITAAATTAAASTDAPEEEAAAPEGEPIIFGHSAGYTGFMSVFDLAVLQGMEMAVADINASGGLLGRPVEIVTSNNETDFAKIQTSALEVLEAGANFLVPSCDFDVGGPAARVANENNIIAIGCAGGPLFGFEGIGPLTYNTYHSSPVEGSIIAELAADHGIEAPYVLIDQTLEYTQSVGETFIARWEELGFELAGQDVFSSDDESIAAQIAGIQSSGADAIILASLPPQGPTALVQLRTAGLDVPIYGAQAFDGVYWVEAIPDVSDFFIPATASIYGDDPVEERNEFFRRLEELTGEPATNSNYPLSGYASVEAIALAVERAGTIETEAVAAELDQFTDEELLIGPTTYTAECHIPSGRPLLILEYVDGQPQVAEERSVEAVAGGDPC
ncbi:ABC transporter substrate-binding protein [Desertimonas flava]|uniref:ABC transporter substrate-binding protein n=1 Tax=Desertimonas flava TaxID=2064846 RepID=UPI000E35721D|nr:ABC transporter substrate-binding protein [Desertimonas flava]